MRKTILIVLMLSIFIIPFTINAQIPNNGFEIWENFSDPANPADVYQKPDRWSGLLPNSFLIHSYSIEKNLDSYPDGTGLYSMIIKSDIENGVDGVAISYDRMSDDISPDYQPPGFPINYRPTSLFLYYKYLPENGDSMRVACIFYKNGVGIGGFDYKSPQIVTSWTLLEIPVSFNTSDIPDSATIMLTTFYNTQHNGSKLYVDNLSFDTFITSVNEGDRVISPKNYVLMQNYPNPFNPETLIQYALPEAGQVRLDVYNIKGERIITLVNEEKQSGYHSAVWNGHDTLGRPVSGGLYLCRIQAEGFRQTIRMILQK